MRLISLTCELFYLTPSLDDAVLTITIVFHKRFGTGELRDYAIAFANTLDPNGAKLGPTWPTWNKTAPVSLGLVDGLIPLEILPDTFRQTAIDSLNALALLQPL